MKQFNTFIFDSYSFSPETGTIELHYSLDDEVQFTETLQIPVSGGREPSKEALFALHLIGGISYFKTCLPKKIEIRSGELSKVQAKFWNDVYENGLGEFFYENEIDFRGLINFPSSKNPPLPVPPPGPLSLEKEGDDGKTQRILVPVGGGKDSIVTMELLKKSGADITLFRMGSHPLIDECVQTSSLKCITAERALSPALFELNEQGALNGHIPISAYLSFLTVVIAQLHDFDAIAMSSERSASEGNVKFHGKEINHQWSKSLEFERMFQNYLHTFITPNIDYFSLLRPLSELRIAQIFSEYPQYFSCTTSCNKNWKILDAQSDKRWCGECPKCAFIFSLFAACKKIKKKDLIKIFGSNFYEDESLLPLYKQLLGIEGFKPFECVGTPDETKAAFLFAQKEFIDTPVMKMFIEEVTPTIKDPKKLIDDALALSNDHEVPEQFLKLLS